MMSRTTMLVALMFLCACGSVTPADDDDDDDRDGGPTDDAPTREVTRIEVSPADPPSIALGLTAQLIATAFYADGGDEVVTSAATWQSDQEAIATVSDGVVTSLALGDAEISASLRGFSDAVTVTVSTATLLSIEVDPGSVSVPAGEAQQFTASAVYSNGPQDVTDLAAWSSSDEQIAAPSPDPIEHGRIYSYAEGNATITATYAGIHSDATLEVTQGAPGTAANPGGDCTDLLANGVTDTGVYWLDPDGSGFGVSAFQAYCDMITDGGGWTLLVWTDDSQTAPFGLPYPGLAPCLGLECARGSTAGPNEVQLLLQRSSELGKGSTDVGGESIIPLGAHAYAGKYTYGPLTGLSLNYGLTTCGAGAWTGSFHAIVGPADYDNAPVYLSQFLAFDSFDYSNDTNVYIWNVGTPNVVCDGSGSTPGTWSGTFDTNQYGPFGFVLGRHAVYVRSGTLPVLVGATPENPGTSCLQILNAGASTGNGVYWLNPTGTGVFQAECDMTTAGGGWTITYDVDAEHFDGVYLNNFTASTTAPTTINQNSDIWNAEAVMSFGETLFACGQQDNANQYYWTYPAAPHDYYASTVTNYNIQTITDTATNGTTGTCMYVAKAGPTDFGFAVIESINCGGCENMLFGMYHYVSNQAGCNSTSSIYGDHVSPWDGRSITYPICNSQQTSNGRFWMAVR